MSYANGPKIVTDGLILCLDAGNSKSYPGTGTTWYDLSGNNLHCSMTGTISYSSSSSVKYFDMSSDSDGYFAPNTTSFNTIANLNTQLTFISWVKFTGIAQTWQNLFGGHLSGISTSYQISMGRWSTDDKYWFEVHTTGGGNSYLNNPTIDSVPINQWVQMAMTCNISSNTLIPYINGSSVGLNTTKSTSLSGTFPDYESGYPRVGFITGHGLSEFYSSAVYVYNRALSADEIRQNYNALKGRYGLN